MDGVLASYLSCLLQPLQRPCTTGPISQAAGKGLYRSWSPVSLRTGTLGGAPFLAPKLPFPQTQTTHNLPTLRTSQPQELMEEPGACGCLRMALRLSFEELTMDSDVPSSVRPPHCSALQMHCRNQERCHSQPSAVPITATCDGGLAHLPTQSGPPGSVD